MKETFAKALFLDVRQGDLDKALNGNSKELVTEYLHAKTGISKEIWSGETRLRTGLQHIKVETFRYNIDSIGCLQNLDYFDEEDYKKIENDPTGYLDHKSNEIDQESNFIKSNLAKSPDRSYLRSLPASEKF